MLSISILHFIVLLSIVLVSVVNKFTIMKLRGGINSKTLFYVCEQLMGLLSLLLCVQENGVEEMHYRVTCGATWVYNVWIFLTVAYKFILNAFGLVMAYYNRNIPVEALNDSTFSSIIIYVAITLTFTVGLIEFLNTYIIDANVQEAMYTVLIVLLSANFLGFTFIPKVTYMITIYEQSDYTFNISAIILIHFCVITSKIIGILTHTVKEKIGLTI